MISHMTELNKNYSTTRCVQKMDADLVIAEIKAAHKPEDKFETVLFLPEGEGRKDEGGLRTQGCFKKSEEDKPLITVVTVVYNGEEFLEETIISVINQTYDNVEYIIIDGGSTDGTLDIIRKYEHVIDYWVSENDCGISDAFNKGVILAQGNGIAMLNADDYYANNDSIFNFAKEISLIDNENYFIYGNTLRLSQKKLSVKKDRRFSWCLSVPFSHCSSIVSKRAYKQVGSYSIKYKIAMDIDLLFRVKEVSVGKSIDKVIAVQRDGGISDTLRLTGYKEYFSISRKSCGFFTAGFFYILKVMIVLKNKVKHA